MSPMDFLLWAAVVIFVVTVAGIVGLLGWAVWTAVQAAGRRSR